MRLVGLLVLLLCSVGHAQEPATTAVTVPAAPAVRSELRASAFFELDSNHEGATSGTVAEDYFTGSLGALYGSFFSPYMEGLASLSISIDAGTTPTQNYSPMVGLAYNFSEDTANAIYLQALAGLNFAKTSSAHSYVSGVFDVGIGKRIQILPRVSWNPQIDFYVRTKATSRESANWERASFSVYRLMPFQLTLLF